MIKNIKVIKMINMIIYIGGTEAGHRIWGIDLVAVTGGRRAEDGEGGYTRALPIPSHSLRIARHDHHMPAHPVPGDG